MITPWYVSSYEIYRLYQTVPNSTVLRVFVKKSSVFAGQAKGRAANCWPAFSLLLSCQTINLMSLRVASSRPGGNGRRECRPFGRPTLEPGKLLAVAARRTPNCPTAHILAPRRGESRRLSNFSWPGASRQRKYRPGQELGQKENTSENRKIPPARDGTPGF
jgi:hypothetical protein